MISDGILPPYSQLDAKEDGETGGEMKEFAKEQGTPEHPGHEPGA